MGIQPNLPKELESVKSSLENKLNGSNKVIDNRSSSKCDVNPMDSNEDARSHTSRRNTTEDISGEEKDTINPLETNKRATSEYISYLLLCQKHSSSNFIHKIDSKEILWNDESIVVKMIGPYILGDSIGKGEYNSV